MNADSNGHGCRLYEDYCNSIHMERAFIRTLLFVEL